MSSAVDINVYYYHTECPNCKGLNTRVNNVLKKKYVLCYNCSLVFRADPNEIKKMLTPFDAPVDINKNFEFANKHISEIIYEEKLKSQVVSDGDLNILNSEIRKNTLNILSNSNFKNHLIFSDIPPNNDNLNITNLTEIEEIKRFVFKNCLKNGKIDFLIFENISNIILYNLIEDLKSSFSNDCKFLIYSPNILNIFTNYINFITDNTYLYNSHTILKTFGYFDIILKNSHKTENFYIFEMAFGHANPQDYNKLIDPFISNDTSHLIYSEPRFFEF